MTFLEMRNTKKIDNKKKLILLQLNEINFDIVSKYIDLYPKKFKGFVKLINGTNAITTAEKEYHNLEPWIQWASVHTGKDYNEHKIFRLGDIVKTNERQIFEIIEDHGYLVGAISPMNAENKLKNPAYFIPDPWTITKSDESSWSKLLSAAISQVVNDNSKAKLTFKSASILIIGLLRFAKFKHYHIYISYIFRSFKAPWRKALALDLFLYDLHSSFFRKKSPNFSTLFLNAGAHIQHHYFFNAKPIINDANLRNPDWYIENNKDPFMEMLLVYDSVLRDIQSLENTEVIVATGLSQVPYDKVKYYYRLKDHKRFISKLGISFVAISPRMTRDFLIEFNSNNDANVAYSILKNIKVNNSLQLFGEIDNRGKSLFVTLTYPDEIKSETFIEISKERVKLIEHVVFVAIKNGMHQSKGFSFFTSGLNDLIPENYTHVKYLHKTIHNFFSKAS